MRASLGVVLIALLALGAGGCELEDITDEGNHAPEADAGADQTVYVGETVTVDGWNSGDADGDDLTYQWSLVEKPDTSAATLSGQAAETATFVPDVPGTYRVRLEVSDGEESATDDVTISASWDLRLTGTLSSDTTLSDRGEPYIVTGPLNVTGAVVIEPGVTIQVQPGFSIAVQSGGSLYAAGTANDSIWFVGTSADAGHWEGIHYLTVSADNVLDYAVVAHTGHGGQAALTVNWNGQLKLSNSLIRDGSAFGLELAASASLPTFANNTFRGLGTGSVLTDPALLGKLDAASSYSAGGPIWVDNGSAATAATWKAVDTEYQVTGDIDVTAAVQVQPGATFRFGPGIGLSVSGAGSFNAVGTAEDSIYFLGSSEDAGHWEGLYFSTKNTSNLLSYAVVAHTGANGHAGITVPWNGRVGLSNSLIRDGATYGLDLDATADVSTFANNTFRTFGTASILTDPRLLIALDAASSYAAGGPVEVDNGTASVAGTWKAIDTFYRVNGSIGVEAAVVVQPGAEFQFAQAQSLDVSESGSLSAVGTVSDTIRFVGQSDVAGFWAGLTFGTLQTANELDYVEVANAGDDGHGNVTVYWNGRLEVSHSLLRDGGAYGLWLDGDATLAAFSDNTLTGNDIAAALIEAPHVGMMDGASTYVGNTGDYIEVYGGYTAAAQTWAKTDVPYRVTSSITVDSPITIEAGARFVFEQYLGLYVDTDGTLTANGQATDMIYFTGAQDVAGFWDGIMFSTVSGANSLNYIDIGFGGSGRDANLMVMWNGSLTVTNSIIHDAVYGIYRDINGSLTATGNTYPSTTAPIFVD